MKPKLLCILHQSPPHHGAAKVGDFIVNSDKINNEFECKFIPIRSSKNIKEIGKFSFEKIRSAIKLKNDIEKAIKKFKPDIIYYTPAIGIIGFLRDYFVTKPIREYLKEKNVKVYYHYHTKGVDKFKKNFLLYELFKNFLKNINLILLSPMLKDEFKEFNINNIYYLPNGIEDYFQDKENFKKYLNIKFRKKNKNNILFLSNMIKSKGYFEVLKLAKKYKNYNFNFAGSWMNENDKKDFFDFIDQHHLNNVKFYGFVNGEEKYNLFKENFIFIFPTKYINEAFPLVLLESLSFGIPVITTKEGSIPYIIDEKSGVLIDDEKDLLGNFCKYFNLLVNIETSKHCRARYVNNFTLKIFEENLVNILKKG